MSTLSHFEGSAEQLTPADLSIIANELKIAPEIVEKTVQLLDEGNTIPFITRFRRDLTGGLNEKQLLEFKRLVNQQRAFNERRAFILKSLESRGSLDNELAGKLQQARTPRELEDLYLPFKTRKQTRAAVAKQQGLEPLADDIFNATSEGLDIASRATQFVRVDKGLNSVDEVIRGVCDLLIERFNENAPLRQELRAIVQRTGKVTSSSLVEETRPANTAEEGESLENAAASEPTAARESATPSQVPSELPSDSPVPSVGGLSQSPAVLPTDLSVFSDGLPVQRQPQSAELQSQSGEERAPEAAPASPPEPASDASTESTATLGEPADLSAIPAPVVEATQAAVPQPEVVKPQAAPGKKKKKKKKKTAPDPFQEYASFSTPLKQILHHQVLALNRGERAGKLKVRIEANEEALQQAVIQGLVPENHPFREFLVRCALESLNKHMLPSVEREVRRQLTDRAERHAIDVFANNLRNLLLQPPMRDRRVLAIDPGFKSGCAVAVLDQCGNVLTTGQIYVVGNSERRDHSKQRIVDWVQQHQINTIAIGTGAACRQAEQLISDAIFESLQNHQVSYVMVNEAGASYYSTSELGREELPDLTPAARSAVSIGRRLQDPLSELVKISPANMGVGMYQHDVKAKHLSDSLDQVVELCVNQVGVDVNTASPALLKYVSGLNSLTARRLVEHRQKIARFLNRMQLKDVPGIGEATFVQAAGFLRIHGGDNPLDSTGIHPESYPLAEALIAKIESSPAELFPLNQQSDPPADRAQAAESAAAQATDLEAPDLESPSSGSVNQSVPQPTQAKVEEGSIQEPLADPPVQEPAAVSEASEEGAKEGAKEGSKEASEEAATDPHPGPSPVSNLIGDRRNPLTPAQIQARKGAVDRLSKLKIDQILAELTAGRHQVKDLLHNLKRPDWDPRERIPRPIFRRGILKLDDLKPDMQLDGQVVNVVDFGVFVDIGLGESSLVHVSQLAHHYVADPHRSYSIGDIVKVWVTEADPQRRRVKLTAIKPGSSPPARGQGRSSGKRSGTAERSGGEGRGERRENFRRKPDDRTSHAGVRGSTGGREQGGGGSRVERFDRKKNRQQSDFNRQREGSRVSGETGRSKHKTKPQTPAPPITEEMLNGEQPMRSFSDLLQFVQQKPQQAKKNSGSDG